MSHNAYVLLIGIALILSVANCIWPRWPIVAIAVMLVCIALLSKT